MSSKILIIGNNPLTFTYPIIQKLRENGHFVDIISLHRHTLAKNDPNNSYCFQTANKFLLLIEFLKRIFLNIRLFIDLKFLRLKSFKDFIYYVIHFHQIIRLKNYDIINMQEISLPYYWTYFLKGQNFKLVSSFWGSDLMKPWSPETKTLRNLWLNLADVITLQTPELKNILETKWATKKEVQIEPLLFPLGNEIFELIEQQKESINDKIIVAIGYNGSSNQNHKKILNQLKKLPTQYLNQITLLLFLQYGCSTAYEKEIDEILEGANFKFEKIKRRMESVELAKYRKKVDIFLMLAGRDAFSASVSESLFAGNIMVCGSWLPYKRYVQNDVFFETIENFEALPAKMSDILDDMPQYKGRVHSNSEKVLKTLDFDGNLNKWVQILSSSNSC